MNIQKVSADRLNPAAYNPRRNLKPGDKDYEKLKRSIEEFGFVEPVVWNGATGNVVGGHQRLKVLLDMGGKRKGSEPRPKPYSGRLGRGEAGRGHRRAGCLRF